MKRAFDIVAASLGLVLLSPFFLVIWLFIKLDSPGPVFFRQERVGRRFRRFAIYKFRTMVQDAAGRGRSITAGEDPRITRLGRFLRQCKIDELPQLINIIKGDMSFVGPRPEIPQYVELFRKDYEEILKIRPGITDLASLKYSNEADILGQSENPEEQYINLVLPAKIKLAKEYMKQSSLWFDLTLIFQTFRKLFDCRTSSLKGPLHERH